MKNGSVIIDLAASTGGNTSQTQNGKTHVYHNVTIAGNSSLADDMPADASKLYGKNILSLKARTAHRSIPLSPLHMLYRQSS